MCPSDVVEWFEGTRNPLARQQILTAGTRFSGHRLMTSIGITNTTLPLNLETEVCDWKRREERLVRASGLPYTIVRPGWFDYNAPDEHTVLFLQGDTRSAGGPQDGGAARRQIAEVLVGALYTDEATNKALELFAQTGPALDDLSACFAVLETDTPGSLNGVLYPDTQPPTDEPARVLADLVAVRRQA